MEEEDEDEDDLPPQRVIKIAKPKKGSKKIPTWFSVDELESEEYDM